MELWNCDPKFTVELSWFHPQPRFIPCFPEGEQKGIKRKYPLLSSASLSSPSSTSAACSPFTPRIVWMKDPRSHWRPRTSVWTLLCVPACHSGPSPVPHSPAPSTFPSQLHHIQWHEQFCEDKKNYQNSLLTLFQPTCISVFRFTAKLLKAVVCPPISPSCSLLKPLQASVILQHFTRIALLLRPPEISYVVKCSHSSVLITACRVDLSLLWKHTFFTWFQGRPKLLGFIPLHWWLLLSLFCLLLLILLAWSAVGSGLRALLTYT